MRILSIALLVVLFMSCQEKPTENKKIVFFGDSITEAGVKPKGYIDQFQQLLNADSLQNEYTLLGEGISGNKVYDLYLRLDSSVLVHNPAKVIIWIGVNDVWHKSLLGTGTDVDRFNKFYEAIIHKLEEKNIEIYLCTPAVVGELKGKQNELDAPLDQYSELIREMAAKHQLGLIDLRYQFSEYIEKNNVDNKSEGILTYDGVHLNDEGNRLVAQWIYEKVFSEN